MKKANFNIRSVTRTCFFLLGGFLAVVTLDGCASQQPQRSASQYRFVYHGESYRIRSIFSEDGKESYNELIGTKFLAADFDQDRILDSIILGEVNLTEAQEIYEYGLDRVTQEEKLQVRSPAITRYVQDSDGLHLEICSFRPANTEPFNEFKVAYKRQVVSSQLIVAVDQNADGRLDGILKGRVALEEVQPQYAEMIEAGLQNSQLVEINGRILVNQK